MQASDTDKSLTSYGDFQTTDVFSGNQQENNKMDDKGDKDPYCYLLGANPETLKSPRVSVSLDKLLNSECWVLAKRKKLLEKSLLPENCYVLEAPKLNAELYNITGLWFEWIRSSLKSVIGSSGMR